MGIKHKEVLSLGLDLLVGPCAVALIMHITDHDTGSPSGWSAQGEPAVTVDYRVR